MAYIELADIMAIDDVLARTSTTELDGRSIAQIATLLAGLDPAQLEALGAAIKAVTDGWVPAGGASGQLLRKTSGADYALGWVDEQDAEDVAYTDTLDLFAPGVENVQAAIDSLAQDVDTIQTQEIRVKTASYIVEEDDVGRFLQFNAGGTLFLPYNDLYIGGRVDFCQAGAGQVTVAPNTGSVTVHSPTGFEPKTRAQGAICTAICTAIGTWRLVGDLEQSE